MCRGVRTSDSIHKLALLGFACNRDGAQARRQGRSCPYSASWTVLRLETLDSTGGDLVSSWSQWFSECFPRTRELSGQEHNVDKGLVRISLPVELEQRNSVN